MPKINRINYSQMPDLALWKSFRSGDTEATTEIFSRYSEGLFWYFTRKYKDPENAADWVQEGFLKLLTSDKLQDEVENIWGYLVKIMDNIARNSFRKNSNRERIYQERLNQEIKEMYPSIVQPDIELSISLEELEKSIQEVSAGDQRMVLELLKEGYAYDEMAKILGKKKAAIYRLTYKARNSLREKLNQQRNINNASDNEGII